MGIVLLVLAVVGAFALFNMVGGLVNLLIAVVIWGLIGWAASRIMGGDGVGIIGNVLIGVVGGMVGRLLFGVLGVSLGGLLGTVIVGVVGAVLTIVVWRAISNNPNFAK